MPQAAYIFGAILLAIIAIYQFQPWSIEKARESSEDIKNFYAQGKSLIRTKDFFNL